MRSALVVSGGDKNIELLSGILRQAGFTSVSAARTGGEARRMIGRGFDLAVINAPLPDESGEALARRIAGDAMAEVLLIARAEQYDQLAAAVEDLGVVTVARPLNQQLIWSAIKLLQASHQRMERMRRENQKLLQKIEDIRVVDRAKCLLISHLSLSEPEAHRYIERQAMDRRTTRREVAEQILSTYES